MAQDQNNLVWLDMEMTGLDPDRDRIIEMAVVITNSQLDTVAESRRSGWCIRPTPCSTPWTTGTRRRTARRGLIDKVKASPLTEAEVEAQMLEFLKQPRAGAHFAHVRQLDLPGPALHGALHAEARSLLPLPQPRRVARSRSWCKRWKPEIAKGVVKNGKHEALADIYESIEETAGTTGTISCGCRQGRRAM